MPKANKSGRIVCTDDDVTYEWSAGHWSLKIRDIAVIGESTNELGPFADDYFICFVRRDGVWFEASFYADGRDNLLECLGKKFGLEFQLALVGSTTFNSRVMWPAELREQPLFDYREPPPTNRLAAWARKIGLRPITNVQTLTEPVQKFVAQTGI